IYIATIDPNDHKDLIIEKFQEETGHTLSLDGEIALSLYPWLGLSLNNISIADDASFSNEDFFSAQFIEARIKLMPLLSGNYEIDTLRVHNTSLNLIRNNAGQGNWESFSSSATDENSQAEKNSDFA